MSASARVEKQTSLDRLLSAMRYQFGGHLEKAPATIEPATVTLKEVSNNPLAGSGPGQNSDMWEGK